MSDDVFFDFDPRLAGCELTPAEAALCECMPVALHAPTYAALYAMGIHGRALTGRDAFDALHVASVCLLPGNRFEFARDLRDATGHKIAVIIPARDAYDETVDLVAWRLDAGPLATWRGMADILGEDAVFGEEAIFGDPLEVDGLRVFPGPAEWLRSGRNGVVILKPESARWRLAEQRLVVTDVMFGRRLRASMKLPEPRVYVEKVERAAA